MCLSHDLGPSGINPDSACQLAGQKPTSTHTLHCVQGTVMACVWGFFFVHPDPHTLDPRHLYQHQLIHWGYDGQNEILFCMHALQKFPMCPIEYGLPWVSLGAYVVMTLVATTSRVT
jgi:hypothetical protein